MTTSICLLPSPSLRNNPTSKEPYMNRLTRLILRAQRGLRSPLVWYIAGMADLVILQMVCTHFKWI